MPTFAKAHARRHCRKTRRSRAPEQLDQQRFRHIITMVRGHQHIVRADMRPQCIVAQLACPRLLALTFRRARIEFDQSELDMHPCTYFAAVIRPRRRARIQAMIDVNGNRPDGLSGTGCIVM